MRRRVARRLVAAGLALGLAAPAAAQLATASPVASAVLARVTLPTVGLRARDIAVVVNDDDPASVETGLYYATRRGIAPGRVVHVRFPAGQPVMSQADFEHVQVALAGQVGADVQAYALAWTLPFRVECMSVTAAFALGFDPASYCAEGCQPTRTSPYFNSASQAPFADHLLRPAMLLAGESVDGVKRLIDRGLRADERWPAGKAYLLSTSDAARNVRAESYERVAQVLGAAYPIERIEADALQGRNDVMFLFTGVANVAAIASNRFRDGAIADHLTSAGGVLSGGGQTTALEWLAAGATGSYGTSTEPCNYRAKFPEVGIVMARYLGGETLIEAYWKSVRMPGQGVFVGDPLARPFGGVRIESAGTGTVLRTRALPPGNYLLQASQASIGPFRTIGLFSARGYGVREIPLPAGDPRHLRLIAAPAAVAPAS